MNLLADNFQTLFGFLMQSIQLNSQTISQDYLIDSMPIMLAKGTRSKQAKVAPEIAKTGFSAVRQSNFHGVRLYLIAVKRPHCLPRPSQIWLREGNVHDLIALREISDQLPSGINLFGDKAYADESFKTQLKERRIQLITPIKKPKEAQLAVGQKQYNKTVSSFQQRLKVFSNG